MIGRHPSQNVRVIGALVSPFVLMFGIYVVAHGHYGPGGGFAGGVILAVGGVIMRMTIDEDISSRLLPPSFPMIAMAVGMLAFLGVGFVPTLVGEPFLDYAATPIDGVDDARLRYLGILVVELAIGLVVFGGLLLIFERLAAGSRT